MLKKTVKKILKKKNAVNRVKNKKKRGSKITSGGPVKKVKKQFIDEDLIKTLEKKGYKRKPQPIPQQEVTQPKKPKIIKQKKPEIIQVNAQNQNISLPVSKTPEIVREHEVQIEQGVEPDLQTNEIKVQPLVEKKRSLFSRIFGRSKKNEETVPNIEVQAKQAVEEKAIEETPVKVKEGVEVKVEENEIKPEKVEVKQEIREEIKEEVKEIEEKPVVKQENVTDEEAFPVAEADLHPEPKTISVFEEEEKEGFFSKIFSIFKSKKKEDEYELEPITVSSSKEDLRYMKEASSAYGGVNDSKEVISTIKQEIMPKQPDRGNNVNQPNRQNNDRQQEAQDMITQKDSQEKDSSMDMIFSDKKKKPIQ